MNLPFKTLENFHVIIHAILVVKYSIDHYFQTYNASLVDTQCPFSLPLQVLTILVWRGNFDFEVIKSLASLELA